MGYSSGFEAIFTEPANFNKAMVINILVLCFMAIMAAHYMWRRDSIRRENEHERRKERYEKLLAMLSKQKKGQEAEVSKSSTGKFEDKGR